MKIYPLLSGLLLLNFCSKDKAVPHDQPIPLNSDLVSTDLRFELDSAQLSPEKAALNTKIQAGEPFSFKEVTRLFVEEHKKDFEKRTTQVIDDQQMAILSELAGVVDVNAAPEVNKQQIEEKLERKLAKKLVYNFESSNLFYSIKEGRLQCYSGTSLLQAVLRERYDGYSFTVVEHHVVIHENGHVLPGYLKLNGAGEWELFGIESTASGPGLKVYGAVSGMSNQSSLVIPANDWAILEIFKKHLKKDRLQELTESVLLRMKKKYGFNFSTTAKAELLKQIQNTDVFTLINSSPFSFGVANVSAGDRPRAFINVSYAVGAVASLERSGRSIPKAYLGRWNSTFEGEWVSEKVIIKRISLNFQPNVLVVEYEGLQSLSDEESLPFKYRSSVMIEGHYVENGIGFTALRTLSKNVEGKIPEKLDFERIELGEPYELVEIRSETDNQTRATHRLGEHDDELIEIKHRAVIRLANTSEVIFEVEHEHHNRPLPFKRANPPKE